MAVFLICYLCKHTHKLLNNSQLKELHFKKQVIKIEFSEWY